MGDMADALIEEGLEAIWNHGNYECGPGCPVCDPQPEEKIRPKRKPRRKRADH